MFGEEYNLWASDKDLTNVLRAHKDMLDPNIAIDEPVTTTEGKRGIGDLMFSKVQRKYRANDIEHLVVVLKAPNVVLSTKDMTQIEDYAGAVFEDPRFHPVDGLRWHFWLVSDEYDDKVQWRINAGPDRRGKYIAKDDRIGVGIKTWAEIIADNQARLQYLKRSLEHKVDDGKALAYLREQHGDLVKEIA